MRLIKIDSTNLDAFRTMMSIEAQTNVELGHGVVALGIIDDNSNACAEIVARFNNDDTTTILSIYVIPKLRRMGIGTELVYAVTVIAEDNGADSEFLVEFSEFEDQQNGLKEFFAYLEYSVEELADVKTFSMKAEDMLKNEVIRKTPINNIKSFAELSRREKNDLFNEDDDRVSISVLSESLEPDCSCFVTDGKEVIASLIANHEEDEIYVDWVKIEENPVDFVKLAHYFIKKVNEKYGRDKIVNIPVINDISNQLVEKLFGGITTVLERGYKATYSFLE